MAGNYIPAGTNPDISTQLVSYVVTSTLTGFTIDVTNSNLLNDTTVKDFVVANVTTDTILDNALFNKTSPTLLTYVGPNAVEGETWEVKRQTPVQRYQYIAYRSIFDSSIYNQEIERLWRRIIEADVYGIGPGSIIDNAALDQAYGAAWATDTFRSRTAKVLYDKIETLVTTTLINQSIQGRKTFNNMGIFAADLASIRSGGGTAQLFAGRNDGFGNLDTTQTHAAVTHNPSVMAGSSYFQNKLSGGASSSYLLLSNTGAKAILKGTVVAANSNGFNLGAPDDADRSLVIGRTKTGSQEGEIDFTTKRYFLLLQSQSGTTCNLTYHEAGGSLFSGIYLTNGVVRLDPGFNCQSYYGANVIKLGWTGTALRLGIDTVDIGDINVTPVSDMRVKKNIRNKTAMSCLNTILDLHVKDFRWDKTKLTHLDDTKDVPGFLAQEVEVLHPELVRWTPMHQNADTNNPSELDHYRIVDYQNLIPLLVGAIQELAQRLQRVR